MYKRQIQDALDELKKAHESQDVSAINSAMEKINNAWNDASQELYSAMNEGAGQAGQNPAADGAQTSSETSQGTDDVEDVDFEEVK